MEEVAKSVIEKVSSYDLFNNFFPGIIFCYIVERFTRISFVEGELWEKLFLYYFIGMILSRIGSMIVEKLLKKIQIKNEKTKEIEPFLNYAPYDEYMEAEEKEPFIKTLNTVNNIYRTMTAMFIVVMGVKLYDIFLYDYVVQWEVIGKDVVFICVCLILIVLFAFSNRKQTAFIRSRVKKIIKSKQTE